MYGSQKEAVPLSVDPVTVGAILHSDSGANTIFSLRVAGGQANAMVKDYQLDPVSGRLIHTDFIEIAMDKLLEVTVPIEVVGEAEGVKLGGGIMDIVTRAIEIECLPADIPESIKIDVTPLKINAYTRVRDIQVDAKLKILTDPDVVLVTIVPPIKEEAPAVEAAPAAVEPEVIKKGKVAEEGEEAAPEKGKGGKPESK
jgi:large subunit ribosomal protein L25